MIVNKDNLLVLKVFLTCFEGFDLRNYLFIYFFGCCSAHNLVTTCFHRVSIFFFDKDRMSNWVNPNPISYIFFLLSK
jgi:hypothetical protein